MEGSEKQYFNPEWLKGMGLPVGLEFKSSVDRVYKNDSGYGYYNRQDFPIAQFDTFQEAFWYAYNDTICD